MTKKWVSSSWSAHRYLAEHNSGDRLLIDLLTQQQRLQLLRTKLIRIHDLGNGLTLWYKK